MRGGWVERGTVMSRLSRAHFAFFRGYLDGLDVGELAERYLTAQMPNPSRDTRPDLRLAKSAVKWIRSQLLVLARRRLTAADVRLLALAPALLLVEYGAPAPPLEQFREENDADGMCSEAELISIYHQMHGDLSAQAERRAIRNRRLRQRQQQALNQLEAETTCNPRPTDRLDGWLDPTLAMRLHAIGVDHLADLVALIDRYGYRWYHKVPRIGIKAALQIGQWLQDDTVRLIPGLQPAGRPYQAPRSVRPSCSTPKRTAMVGLEHFCMPSGLICVQNGAIAQVPDPNTITAGSLAERDDVAAIIGWLSTKPLETHTWRAYRKEAERLLLWSVLERGKRLGALNVDDCIAYCDFLALLGRATEAQWELRFQIPQALWIGAPAATRDSRHWRPFHGPLAAPSQRQAATIVKGMLGWLNDQGYLQSNPMPKHPGGALCPTALTSNRLLDATEWQAVCAYLRRQQPGIAQGRLRCLLGLAAGAGLRLAELASLRRGHAKACRAIDDKCSGWALQLPGATGKWREIPLNHAVLSELQQYFQQRGFPNFADAPVHTPVIAALSITGSELHQLSRTTANASLAQTPLTVDRIHRIIKRMFKDVAAECHGTDPAMAARLQAASCDWLRHAVPGVFTLEVMSTPEPLLSAFLSRPKP